MSLIDDKKLGASGISAPRAIISYSSAMLVSRFLTGVQGLVLIRLLEPEVLGVWLGLQLIALYGVHAHFGLINAVNRQVPFYRGRNELDSASNVEELARGSLSILSAVGLCVLAALYPSGWFDSAAGRGALAVTMATIININVQFYVGLFRARHEFGKAGLISVINSVVIFIGLPLVYFFGFNGLLWRAIVAAVIVFISCIAMDGFVYRMKHNGREVLGLIRIGFPIMVMSYGIVLFSAMDRTLILLFLDERAMGEYALCFAAATIVSLLPGLIGQVYYPRMTEAFSVSGITRGLVRICAQSSLVSAAIAGCVCLACYFVLPPVVDLWFPKYTQGVPALRIALIAYFLLSFTAGPNYFLISTVQKRRQFMIYVAAAVLMLLSGYWLANYGLVGIAWSLVIGVAMCVFGLWTIVFASLRWA